MTLPQKFPPRRLLSMVKRIRDDLRSEGHAERITSLTIEAVLPDGRFQVSGVPVPVTGIGTGLTVGQQVQVGWLNGAPVAILAHHAQGEQHIRLLPSAGGIVEELFWVEDPTGTPPRGSNGANDVYFRNFDTVVPLNLTSRPGWPAIVNGPSASQGILTSTGTWGQGRDRFWVRAAEDTNNSADPASKLYAVFKIQSKTKMFNPGEATQLRLNPQITNPRLILERLEDLSQNDTILMQRSLFFGFNAVNPALQNAQFNLTFRIQHCDPTHWVDVVGDFFFRKAGDGGTPTLFNGTQAQASVSLVQLYLNGNGEFIGVFECTLSGIGLTSTSQNISVGQTETVIANITTRTVLWSSLTAPPAQTPSSTGVDVDTLDYANISYNTLSHSTTFTVPDSHVCVFQMGESATAATPDQSSQLALYVTAGTSYFFRSNPDVITFGSLPPSRPMSVTAVVVNLSTGIPAVVPLVSQAVFDGNGLIFLRATSQHLLWWRQLLQQGLQLNLSLTGPVTFNFTDGLGTSAVEALQIATLATGVIIQGTSTAAGVSAWRTARNPQPLRPDYVFLPDFISNAPTPKLVNFFWAMPKNKPNLAIDSVDAFAENGQLHASATMQPLPKGVVPSTRLSTFHIQDVTAPSFQAWPPSPPGTPL